MNERLLARLLYVGLVVLGALTAFGPAWSEAGAGWRAAVVVSALAAAGGVGLDFRHRFQDRRRTLHAHPTDA